MVTVEEECMDTDRGKRGKSKQKLVFWKSGILRKHKEEIAVNGKSYLGFIS